MPTVTPRPASVPGRSRLVCEKVAGDRRKPGGPQAGEMGRSGRHGEPCRDGRGRERVARCRMAPRRRQRRGGCSPSWISSVALRIAARCEQNKLRQHNVCLGSWTSGLSADPHPPLSMSRGSIRPWMGRSRGPSHGPGRPHGCWPSSLPRAGPPAGALCATTAAGVRWPSASPRPPEKRAEDSRGVTQGRTRVRDKAGLSV